MPGKHSITAKKRMGHGTDRKARKTGRRSKATTAGPSPLPRKKARRAAKARGSKGIRKRVRGY